MTVFPVMAKLTGNIMISPAEENATRPTPPGSSRSKNSTGLSVRRARGSRPFAASFPIVMYIHLRYSRVVFVSLAFSGRAGRRCGPRSRLGGPFGPKPSRSSAVEAVEVVEQVADHVGRRVVAAVPVQQLGEAAEVLAEGHQRWLGPAAGPALAEPDGGKQRVAQAPAVIGVLRQPALPRVLLGGLGRAAVTHAAVSPLVRGAQIAEIAQPRPGRVDVRVGERAGQFGGLEGESGRRGMGAVAHGQRAGRRLFLQPALQPGVQAGLAAEREGRACLYPGGARGPGRRYLLWCRVASGEPERQAVRGDLVLVD